MKSIREAPWTRTPSVPKIVMTYLPTVVLRVVVIVRVEVEVEPWDRVTMAGLSVGLGGRLVTGSTVAESVMGPE